VQQVHIMQGARPDEVTVEWAEDAMDATPTSLQYRIAACDNTDGTGINTPFCDRGHQKSAIHRFVNWLIIAQIVKK
jgi:hypothetical protein